MPHSPPPAAPGYHGVRGTRLERWRAHGVRGALGWGSPASTAMSVMAGTCTTLTSPHCTTLLSRSISAASIVSLGSQSMPPYASPWKSKRAFSSGPSCTPRTASSTSR